MKKPLVLLGLFVVIAAVTVGCSGKLSSPADALLQQADELRLTHEYEAAIETYQAVRDKYPDAIDDSHVQEIIAFCYSRWAERLMQEENNYDDAIKKLRIIIEQYPDNEVARTVVRDGHIPLAYLGWASYLNNIEHDYQSALEKCESVIDQYPQTEYVTQAKEQLAWCYDGWGRYLYGEDDYAGAVEKYEIVLAEYPNSEPAAELNENEGEHISWCYFQLIVQQAEEGSLNAALENYNTILQRWPSSPWVSTVRGAFPQICLTMASQFEQEGRWGEAFQTYQEILSQSPDSLEAFDVKIELLPQCAYEYARLLQGEGRYEEAIEKYEISGVAEAREALPECYYLSAKSLAEGGKPRKALDKYITILNDYPDTIWASWEKGEILGTIPADYLYEDAKGLGITEAATRLYKAILDYYPESGYIERIGLIEARRSGLVEVAASGAGDLNSVFLTLTSNSAKALAVAILPGTIFGPQSAGIQNMLVLTEKEVVLCPHERIESVDVDAACGNMRLDLPGKSDALTLSLSPASGDLMKLLSLPDFQEETSRVRQFAIWTITDNPGRYDYMGIRIVSQAFGTGPSDEELEKIRVLFEKSGIPTEQYKALS
jgi:tetratricopeptide (TPR) repeat protein